jgi:hypothetical protein
MKRRFHGVVAVATVMRSQKVRAAAVRGPAAVSNCTGKRFGKMIQKLSVRVALRADF